jgi:RNA polymerase sigma-70 factor (ECF subfamily)
MGAGPFSSVLYFAHSDDAALRGGILGIVSNEKRGGLGTRRRIIELYDQFRPSLYGYLISLGLAPQQADDAVQETFLRLFEHLQSDGSDRNLRSWLFCVAHNLSQDIHRRERRMVNSSASDQESVRKLLDRVDPGLNPEELYLHKERSARLASAVAQLSEQQRQCMHLRAEGLRYREISAVLGISVSTVAESLQRAIDRIVGRLNE